MAWVVLSTVTLPIILLSLVVVSHFCARTQSSQSMLRPTPNSGLDHPHDSLPLSAKHTSPSTLHRANASSHPELASTTARLETLKQATIAVRTESFIVSLVLTSDKAEASK
jgi:hypothetical protein